MMMMMMTTTLREMEGGVWGVWGVWGGARPTRTRGVLYLNCIAAHTVVYRLMMEFCFV